MRAATFAVVAALAIVAHDASAQNQKESCADASERGQKLVDARKLLEARNAFIYCSQDSCPTAVRRDCQAQLEDVRKNIPSVVVRVKEKSGSDVARGEVSLDGVKVGVLDGQDVQVDPGAHAIAIALPDGRSFSRTLVIAPGERRDVLFDSGASPSRAPVAAEAATPAASGGWSGVRTVGFVGILVGSGAIVGGLVFQLLAVTLQSNANTLLSRANASGVTCNLSQTAPTGNPDCDSAIDDHGQALSTQNVALGLLIGGAVLTVAGAVMFAVGGNRPARAAVRVTPTVGPHFAGLSFGGDF